MSAPAPEPRELTNAAGLRFRFLSHGALQRIDVGALLVGLFLGNEVEGGPANLWLRRHGDAGVDAVPLLGPGSPMVPVPDAAAYRSHGLWHGLQLQLTLCLAPDALTWRWDLRVDNGSEAPVTLDLIYLQDVGLCDPGAARTNEYYVSHYVDLSPMQHPDAGWVVAARQNQAIAGRYPWLLAGSMHRTTAYATDALQWQGLGVRAGLPPMGLTQGLPSRRLQHEQAVVALQEQPWTLAQGEGAWRGFFGHLQLDHPQASAAADLAWVDQARAGLQARPVATCAAPLGARRGRSWFATTDFLRTSDLDPDELVRCFPAPWRHEELDNGRLLSFTHGPQAHVALRAKELLVMRPHGHILRTGDGLVPDETALTSTVWMGGVFHSLLTQGHVSINRFLSTVRGWLGQFRSHGQRIFVRFDGDWVQLGLPSAFEMQPQACRWIYKHPQGLIEVRSCARSTPHEMGLGLHVLAGRAVDVLVSHHVDLGSNDDGESAAAVWQGDERAVFVQVPAGSALARRFPGGGFRIETRGDTRFDELGGDELLYDDGISRAQPFVCLVARGVTQFELDIRGALIQTAPVAQSPLGLPRWQASASGARSIDAARMADMVPWYHHNAMVHYLAPRGLEQFTGGGWGTRDVCQGPLEMLLALDRPDAVRDLLLRVYAAQNQDGDWPQWFMFFARDSQIRAGDSHGDIVFWPLLGLARYLIASGDASILEQPVPFHDDVPTAACPLWMHVERALSCIAQRQIAPTQLVAYGHGDWNDSLQPVDPGFRERLCSAWTVTLHYQTLVTLARGLRAVDREPQAMALQAQAAHVLADFQRVLIVDDVLTGYAHFDADRPPQYLLHPRDKVTGVKYSLLPMVHAVLGDMLSTAQAHAHRALIEQQLKGVDGARLFDAPMPYRGGPARLFQRAETSAFFGREIGVMYMHAHLRYAEMLAHLGLADAFFDALGQAHPLGLRDRVPAASVRQSNCYFSSSDAAFADRYEAQRDYGAVRAGTIALDGGWRIYSSGPGIAIGLWIERFLGVRQAASSLTFDPVIPVALDGLRATVQVAGRELNIVYRVAQAGCGPRRLLLNGVALPFERAQHAYRCGGAVVDRETFCALLLDGANELTVDLA